ncbi:MAG: TonB-dependent receptor [Flavobacteriales bacterium]|nr:TonB-dependent receptor [Flavobacteriales bacterium]
MLRISLLSIFIHFVAAAIAQKATISGYVFDKVSNEALVMAGVQIQGTTNGAFTDENGFFSITNLQPGLYNLVANYAGYKQAVLYEIEVTNDRPAQVEIRMESEVTEVGEVTVSASTVSNREESPLSVRTIGPNEIKRNPGGNRDISRVIRTLPGVAAIPSFRNDIVIRGGAPNENRFYIDGIEIPNINHFATQGASGGPVGMINVDLVEEVEFYSGAFPSARGNALSSVMEFGFRQPRDDKFIMNMVVGSSDLGITVEGPTSPNSGIILSARRSYLQFLFRALQLPFLPAYNDLNTKWTWRISEKDRLSFIAIGAYDTFDINLDLDTSVSDENFARNRYLLDNLVTNEQWSYSTGLRYDHYTDKGRMTLVVSRNALQNDAYRYPDNNESLPRELDYTSRETENKLRGEWKHSGRTGWKWLVGFNFDAASYNNRSALSEYNALADTLMEVDYVSAYDMLSWGVFAQSSKNLLSDRLVVSAGIRTDANNFGEEMMDLSDQVSPRLSLRYRFAPGWSLNAGAGMYFQRPSYLALGFADNTGFRNDDLQYIQSNQAALGIEYDFSRRNSVLSLESFYKKYDQYPVSVARGISLANLGADFGTVGNEDLVSIGLGRAYGIEFLYQQKLFEGFYGIFAYTYVRSEFTGTDGVYIPSSWDSRHLISWTGGKKFSKNWEVGFRFQYSGGLPFTPDNENASMLIANWDALQFAIPDWSQLNTQRIDAFHQLDVRVDKKWFFTKWSLDLFLDIQNVYNSVTPLKPTLDALRDEAGNPVVNPNDPSRYLPNYLDNSNGNLLPSIGIIVEL